MHDPYDNFWVSNLLLWAELLDRQQTLRDVWEDPNITDEYFNGKLLEVDDLRERRTIQ